MLVRIYRAISDFLFLALVELDLNSNIPTVLLCYNFYDELNYLTALFSH